MRLLLDAHLSGKHVGDPLRAQGHDVRALEEERALEGLPDRDVLAFASHEDRILVTHDVGDFPELLRDWAETGRSHAGVVLVYGIDPGEFGLILRGLAWFFELRPDRDAWSDHVVALSRGTVENE